MTADLRRWISSRRKIRQTGLRIIRKDWCLIEYIQVPRFIVLGDVPTWFGKWGYRSFWGHKWHQRVFTRYRLWGLLVRYFHITYIRPEPRWPTRHLCVPQWYTFRGERR